MTQSRRFLFAAVHLAGLFAAAAVSAATVAYYRFDDTSGQPVTAVIDSGPNALDGTNVGTAVYARGISGTSYDGTGDLNYVRVPHSPLLVLPGDFTVEMFFRPKQPYTAYGSDPSSMIAKHHTASVGTFLSSFSLEYSASGHLNALVSYNTGIGLYAGVTPATYAAGQWHHVALVFQFDSPSGSNSLSLYVDYQLATRGSGPKAAIAWGNFPMAIGAGNYPGGQDTSQFRRNFDGRIDEVRISDVALLPSEFLTMPLGEFQPLTATKVSEGVEVSWSSTVDSLYQLQATLELSSTEWANAGAPLEGTGGLLKYVEANASQGDHRYFRVAAQP